uniref:Uncharacterized protein n=1 Tax=Cannabis sativa TaxID=3483 RepID=A0A803Q8E9_CANSA
MGRYNGVHALYYGLTWGTKPGVVPRKVWLSILYSDRYGRSSLATSYRDTTHSKSFRNPYRCTQGSPQPPHGALLLLPRLGVIMYVDAPCVPALSGGSMCQAYKNLDNIYPQASGSTRSLGACSVSFLSHDWFLTRGVASDFIVSHKWLSTGACLGRRQNGRKLIE